MGGTARSYTEGPKLRLERLSKSFGGKRVLDGLDLDVAAGECLVILGPSGEGKSVLLKHLIGLLRPDAGRVLIEGVDLWGLPENERGALRRRFGMAFQEGALFDSLSTYENVAFPLRRHTRWSQEQIDARVRVCLSTVRLTGVEAKRPSELSAGMRRRVGFARAIALSPEILLFDEPTAGLDPVMVTAIAQVITSLHRDLGATTVMVTHDLQSARKVADRVALLFGGKIVASAKTEDFFSLEHPAVRQLVRGSLEGPILGRHEPALVSQEAP